jgi:hypothetical protein
LGAALDQHSHLEMRQRGSSILCLSLRLDLLLLLDDLRLVRDGFRRDGLAVALGKQLHLIGKSQPFVCNSLPAGFDG